MPVRSALAEAREYLSRLIRSLEASNQTRLPPLKRIATAAGVSHTVMSTALSELRESGAVEMRPRRGTSLVRSGTRSVTLPPRPPTPHRWQRVCGQMRQDLADGVFGSGAMPSQKELTRRYHLSQKTLAKCLSALADEGLVVPHRRTYRLAVPWYGSSGGTIVLFARASMTGELAVYSPRTPVQFSALEQACAARNTRLQIIPCYYLRRDIFGFTGWANGTITGAFDPQRVHGFMVWQTGLDAGFTGQLVASLRRFNKPLALYAEQPDELTAPDLPASNLVRRYSPDPDFQAGLAVGRFLRARGHHHVCCWAAVDDVAWVRERVAGIRNAFDGTSEENALEVHYAFRETKDHAALTTTSALSDALEDAFARVARAWNVEPTQEQTTEIATDMAHQIYRMKTLSQLEPAMTKSLRDGRSTAWVGINDLMAVDCLHYLQSRQVHTPKRISVVGFDDGFEAGIHHLSSYSFNPSAVMNRMTDFITWPNAPVSRAEPGTTIRVPGFVHERATTGPAPRDR